MAQYPPAITILNSSALQQPITLQCMGNLVTVGAPGNPVTYSSYGLIFGQYIIPALANSAGRTIAHGPTG